MQKLNYQFFNPTRHHQKTKLNQPKKFNRKDYKKIWMQDYKLYRGNSYNNLINKDSKTDLWAKLFYSDAYFPLLIGLCQAFQSSDEINDEKLQSNLGFCHYINPFAPLSLLIIALSVSFKLLAEKYEHKHPRLSKALMGVSYAAFYTLGVPLMVGGFVSELVFTGVQALISALMATLSSAFNYVGKVDKSVVEEMRSTWNISNPLLEDSTSTLSPT